MNPTEERPKFLTESIGNKLVNLRESLTLKNTFTGSPIPLVDWLKNGEVLLASDARFLITTNEKTNETCLTIRSARTEDTGEYSCKISNSEGIAVATCHIQVELESEDKLAFVSHIRSQYLVEGEPLVLECEARANRKPISVVWMRNGKEIPQNPDFICSRVENVFKLTVNEIYLEDSGLFSAQLVCPDTGEKCVCSCSVFVKGY